MGEDEQRDEKRRELARYRHKVAELEAELDEEDRAGFGDDRDAMESYESLLAAERIGSMANVARAIAHEINNPLATCMGYLRRALTMAEQRHDGELTDVLERLWRGAFRIKSIVGELQLLSEEVVGETEKLDLVTIVERVSTLIPPEMRAGIDYQLESVRVLVDRPRLYQIVYNMIMAHILATDHHISENTEEEVHRGVNIRSGPTEDGRAELEIQGDAPPRMGTRTDLLAALRGEQSPSTLPLRLAQRLAEEAGGEWHERPLGDRYCTRVIFDQV